MAFFLNDIFRQTNISDTVGQRLQFAVHLLQIVHISHEVLLSIQTAVVLTLYQIMPVCEHSLD